MNSTVSAAVAVIGGIVGLAIVAVLVSQKAQTSGVIQAAGSALSGIIGAAVGPITGSTASSTLGNPLGLGSGNLFGNVR
jgi:hypothetical protein